MKSKLITLLMSAALATFLFAAGPGGVSSGLQMWLDANAESLSNNDPVSSWTDQSGTGHNASQDSTAIQPLYKTGIVNGKPAIEFAGKVGATGAYLNYDGSIIVSSNYSIFVVARRAASSPANHYILGGTDPAAYKNLHVGWRVNDTFTHAHYSNDYNMKMDTYTAQEKPIIVSLRHSSTLGNDTYINGGLRGLNMLETTRKSHLNAYIGASIGRYMATGINNRFKGWVAEVIMYNRYLSETERKAVESYLSTKYAITVASTASPEHYTNMFELAVSASPTTQTKESGGLTIKGDYKAAAARIRAGHDNAEGIAATFNPNSSTYPDFYRLKREWFLNIIGILDAKFSFDLDDLGLSDINPSGNKYCLLFRNDSKNNFTVIDSVATINGKVISFTRSSLTSVTHNGFYTLGTLDNDESSLPIELSSFLGALTLENNVRLQWITQSETGVSGFYLLRNISKELNNALQISSLIPANNSSGMSYYDFTDTELSENGTYYYWLQCLNLDSSTSLYGPVTVVYQPNGDVTVPELPIITGISSTYPNPFNPSINIAYSIKESADVQMKVFNLKGQMLKQWSYPKQTSGRNTLVWDAKDLPSGVYLLSFEAGDFKQTKRITLAK